MDSDAGIGNVRSTDCARQRAFARDSRINFRVGFDPTRSRHKILLLPRAGRVKVQSWNPNPRTHT